MTQFMTIPWLKHIIKPITTHTKPDQRYLQTSNSTKSPIIHNLSLKTWTPALFFSPTPSNHKRSIHHCFAAKQTFQTNKKKQINDESWKQIFKLIITFLYAHISRDLFEISILPSTRWWWFSIRRNCLRNCDRALVHKTKFESSKSDQITAKKSKLMIMISRKILSPQFE